MMKPRVKAQDHSKVVGQHKPTAKPGILAAIMTPPLTRGATTPVGQPTQPDTRVK
jgi:hypothetical protein